MRIVVGTDGSDDAVTAAQRATAVLASDATVHLICVVDEPSIVASGMESGFAGSLATPEEVDGAWDDAIAAAQAAVERTASALSGVHVETHVEHGAPGPVLCEQARAQEADVVVVGSRGRGAIKRALLGSVSSYVVHNAPCPVLVVRESST